MQAETMFEALVGLEDRSVECGGPEIGHDRPNRGRLRGEFAMRYALLWLIGVPIPVLIVVYFLFH